MARYYTDTFTGAEAVAVRERNGRSGRDRGEWLVVAWCGDEEMRLLAYRDPENAKKWRTTQYIMGRMDGFASLADVANIAMRAARRNARYAYLVKNGWIVSTSTISR